MSNQHVPSASGSTAGVPTSAPGSGAPVPEGSKPAKSKGLRMYNRIAVGFLVLFLAVAVTMVVMAQRRVSDARRMDAETQSIRKQTAEILAPRWCAKVTAENIGTMEDIYQDYYDASTDVRRAIEEQCPKRVDIARMVKTNKADTVFDTTSTCTIAASGTTASCSVDITPANDASKKQLEAFSSTTVTLEMWFSDKQFFTLQPSHTIENVATVTVDSSGTATVDFEVPYDSSWGDYYGIEASSFFPNE